MKLAFMTFACPDWTVPEIIDGALRYGYDGVELRVDSGHQHGLEVSSDAATRRNAVQRFQEAGIDIPCVATSLRFARSGKAGETECAAALPLLDLAVDLGARGLRVFGGEPVRDETASSTSNDGNGGGAEITRDEATRWATDNLRSIADEAAARGVALWFETHDYFRLGRDTAAVLRRVDHPWVRCNWDVMHPQLNGEDFSVTKKELSGLVAYTHFHDAKTASPATICPFGEGSLPLLGMLQWLRDEGFDGYLSAEYFGNSLGDSPDESLPLWASGCRRLLVELDAS